MKKFRFATLICYALIIVMLIPFGSMAAKNETATFVSPEYKNYSAGGESSLEIVLDYEPDVWFGFSVIDHATGEVYQSNPVYYNESTKSASTERNKTEYSQLFLEYNYDENGNRDRLEDSGYVSSASKKGTFYSYDHCVVRNQLKIVALDVDGNELPNSEEIVAAISEGQALSDEVRAQIKGYKVTYGLGNINPDLYAEAISPEDLEYYISQLVDENGNPDEDAQEFLRKKYKLINMESLNKDLERSLKNAKDENAIKTITEMWEENLEKLILKYPGLAEEGYEVYELYPDALKTKKVTDMLIEAWVNAGLTKEGLETIYENISYEIKGAGVYFYIPVVYMIEGNTFKVEVVTEDIEYCSEVAIIQLDVLPHFAAELDSDNEEGYTVIPDGSGAIIQHGTGDMRVNSIAVALGDRHKDEGLSRNGNNISAIPYFEHCILPVFGMKQDNRAVFAVVEKAYEMANVYAYMYEGGQNQYNYTYASFFPTPTDKIYYSDGSAADIQMFPKYTVPTEVEIKTGKNAGTVEIQNWNYCRLPDTSLVVRYNFLYEEEANYVGMAAYFRQYLIDVYGLEKVVANENTTFYADIYGAIQKKVSVLGFPIEKKFAVTDFEEAEIIVDALLENVGELSVRYLGMANGSLYANDYSDHFKPLFTLGGKKGYSQFLSNMDAKGVSIYPDVDATHVYVDKSFDGFMPYFDAVRTMGKTANIIENHNIATGLYASASETAANAQNYYFPRWAVTPAKYEEVFAGLKSELEVYGNKNIALSSVGNTLSADYDEALVIDRTQSSRAISAGLDSYVNDGYSVAVEKGNFWALPYADIIYKIPTTSSKFIIEDYEIPFVQMAIHGLIEYTGEEINTVQDAQYQILKCLEYGCSLSARLMYEEDMVLQNTYYTTVLYSLHYENWLEQINEMYTTVNDVLKDVQDQYIVGHEMLATNVFVTTYENGLTIAVNYNKEACSVSFNGTDFEIEANSFVILEKGE